MKKIFLYCVLCIVYFVSNNARAEFIVPTLPDSPVYDEAWFLTGPEKIILEQKIFSLEQQTSHQIGIVIINSLQERTIEEVWVVLARSWWIGQKNLDNGLLILIAPIEREVRIEVGRGLEWVITDLVSQRIIDENMTPKFTINAYAEWISEALDRMTPLLRGEIKELPNRAPDSLWIIVSLVFWLVWWGFFLGSVFFEPSRAWWPGMITWGVFGWIVMWIAGGTLFMALIGIFVSSWVLWGVDYLFSKGIIKAMNSRPNGGRWWGWGGFGWGGGKGGGWGGFWWGGFGWGGASWRW